VGDKLPTLRISTHYENALTKYPSYKTGFKGIPMNEKNAQQQLEVLKIYVKDASLEVPNAPNVFNEQRQPAINVHIATRSTPVADTIHEVVLTLTVTAKIEDATAYLVELHQAGVFSLQNFTEEQQGPTLGIICPGALFPFAREALASLISKGGFPPLLLNPVNFDALYRQRQNQPTQPSTSPH
jgi:preprotein translocase subunit SecB